MTTVLVVERDPSSAEVLALLLPDEGYCAILVATTDEAIVVLSGSNQIDLIISDLPLRVYSEASWTDVHRLHQAAPQLPIIVCTAHEAARHAAIDQFGVDAVLVKPFGLHELLHAIGHVRRKPE